MAITLDGSTGIDMGNTPVSNISNGDNNDAVNKDYAIGKVISTDNAVVRFNGTAGEVQNSSVTVDDNGNINSLGSQLNVYGVGGNNTFEFVQRSAGKGFDWYTNGGVNRAMVLDAGGHLLVAQSSGTSHAISGNNYATGLPIIQFGGDYTTNAVAFFAINQQAWSVSNAAATAIRVGNSTSGRSINASGTINASGADYAEYEYSNDIAIAKGQIVGFKEDGTLTDRYNESVRFAIKSTNPSMVGGDVWGAEDVVGKKPEQPVRKLDKTEQVQIDGSEEFETVVIEAGDTDAEWEAIEAKYKAELADFEARLEVERQKVDRIAYAGKVPVNVYGATAGQYIVAIEKDGGIAGLAVNKADMTFEQYQDTVGRVNKILNDGRAEVAVIIH